MAHKAICEFCEKRKIKYCENEPMCLHTSFKTGGNADVFINVCNQQQLSEVLKELNARSIPFFVIGKGSNLLISDKGIDGAVISLSGMDKITVDGECIIAEAGASLAAVCVAALKNSLTGLEALYGIPASVGGALYMNAGAYGGEMSQVAESACYVSENGEIGKIDVVDMRLGYRTSVFKKEKKIITSVTFKLKKGNCDEIRSAMDDYMSRRREKQPLEYPSAGSTFKRPEGHFAGALIEKNGLKGKSIGGAMVSEKHAGFLINYDNAKSDDIKELMKFVADTVFEADGVRLEPEVIFVGRE